METTNINDKKDVVLWIRVSSENQAEKYSLEAQKTELIKYCLENNLNAIKLIECVGSGFDENNKQLQELLEIIDEGQIYAVLFCEKDRLMRDISISGYLKLTAKKKNILLIGINDVVKAEDNETQDLTDEMMTCIKKFETRRKTRRAKRSLNIKFDLGGHIGKCPYGYSNLILTGRRETRPNEFSINVINIFDKYISKDDKGNPRYGYRRLADEYKLSPMMIKNLLHNPFYIGYINRTIDGKEVYRKGLHQPLVKDEVFFKVPNNEKWKSILNIK